MDNQGYYKPEISEFHVGFPYELVEGDFVVSKTFEPYTPLVWIQEKLDEGSLRVKLLNEEDVEVHGFQKIGNPLIETTGELLFVHVINYSLTLRYGARSVLVVLKSMEDPFAMPHFSGECKNASELHKIIRQLGLHNHINYVST